MKIIFFIYTIFQLTVKINSLVVYYYKVENKV